MDNLRRHTIQNNSKSVLFLTELILAILIFALCMGICGSIFVMAFKSATASTNLSNAVFLAENAAESFHLSDDPGTLAEKLGGAVDRSGGIIVCCDRQWQPVEPDKAFYTLNVSITEKGHIKTALISVKEGANEIFSLLSAKNTVFSPEAPL